MLAPWKKSYENLGSILKSRAITLLTKVHIVNAMAFPAVMYGCESWTTKKSECQRTDAFKLWCWRRFLRVPWTAWRSNQSILKEINHEYSMEVLGECVISSVLSPPNKNLKRWTSITALRQTSVIAVRWISVTALCYNSVLFRK